ncbi:MAG: hypothetical protein R3C44_20405 [Chloroflexota bacterium]
MLPQSPDTAWSWPDTGCANGLTGTPHSAPGKRQVRVVQTLIPPGEQTAVHTHCWPGALTILSWSDFVRRDADGNVLVDTRQSPGMPTHLPVGGAAAAAYAGKCRPTVVAGRCR